MKSSYKIDDVLIYKLLIKAHLKEKRLPLYTVTKISEKGSLICDISNYFYEFDYKWTEIPYNIIENYITLSEAKEQFAEYFI